LSADNINFLKNILPESVDIFEESLRSKGTFSELLYSQHYRNIQKENIDIFKNFNYTVSLEGINYVPGQHFSLKSNPNIEMDLASKTRFLILTARIRDKFILENGKVPSMKDVITTFEEDVKDPKEVFKFTVVCLGFLHNEKMVNSLETFN
jgi:hypothetical protein